MRAFTRLLGFAVVGGVTQNVLLFQAQEGFTTVVRDIVLVHSVGSAGNIRIYRSVPGGLQINLWWVDINYGQTLHLDLRQVILPGDALYAYTGIEAVHVSVTGYNFLD
jgi:hypothetical protein